MIEDSFRTALLHDVAVFEKDDMVGGVAGETHLMGDHKHGRSGVGQGFDHGKHLVHHFRIQGGCGLIQHQQFRFQSNGPGYGDTLLLASGEFARITIGEILHSDPLELIQRDALGLLATLALGMHKTQRHVVQSGLVQEKIVILEYESDS